MKNSLLFCLYITFIGLSHSQQLNFNSDLKPFYHGVASGDPMSDRVIIWTRITPENSSDTHEVSYYLSQDTLFNTIVDSGSVTTGSEKDFTVKVDVTGLSAATTYYYYFSYEGKTSIVGRTRTAPDTDSDQLRFAVVSCSNYEAGYFHAYEKIAQRADLDAVIHLGDYLYEYGVNIYGDRLLDRKNIPAHEIVELDDYRTRYSLYRLDASLMMAHQQHPFIAIWDDHESANDAYKDGAENHNPTNEYTTGKTEGNWEERLSAAKKAYFEWMPIRENAQQSIRRTLSYGNLADFICLDTRIEGRTKQVSSTSDSKITDLSQHTILGQEQRDWFLEELATSTATWKIVCNQVIFSQLNLGFAAGFGDGSPDITNLDSINAVENIFLDIWDGYPAERKLIIDSIQAKEVNNIIILTGDFHSSFAFDVTQEPVVYPNLLFNNLPTPSSSYQPTTGQGSQAVEFAVPSVTSANFDENVGAGASALFEINMNNPIIIDPTTQASVNYNPHMKYVDLDRHGYLLLNLEKDTAQGEFYFMNSISEPQTDEIFGAAAKTSEGNANHLERTNYPSSGKSNPPYLAPQSKNIVTSINTTTTNELGILGVYPIPASDFITISFAKNISGTTLVSIKEAATGKVVKEFSNEMARGFSKFTIDTSNLSSGLYLVEMRSEQGHDVIKIIIE